MKLLDMYECAVPAGRLAVLIPRVVERTGYQPTSVGRMPKAAPILNKYGKHTQLQIYNANPAERAAWGILGQPDRPGTSTHECRNDGVVYWGPVGRHLWPWQCGMDWPNESIAIVMRAFEKEGQIPIHPYASGLEYHHINLARREAIHDPFLPLRLGDHGRMVTILSNRLMVCHLLAHGSDKFGPSMHEAVNRYQRYHHLRATGVVNMQTWVSLRASARWHKRHPSGRP